MVGELTTSLRPNVMDGHGVAVASQGDTVTEAVTNLQQPLELLLGTDSESEIE